MRDIQGDGRLPLNELRDRSRMEIEVEANGEGRDPEKPLAERFKNTSLDIDLTELGTRIELDEEQFWKIQPASTYVTR